MKFDIQSLKELAGIVEQKFVGKNIKPAKFAVGDKVCVKDSSTKGSVETVKHADKKEDAPNRYVVGGKTYDENALVKESIVLAICEATEDLVEGARLVGKLTSDDGTCVAKVYRDSEWDQFYVRFEKDGRQLFADAESDGLSYADDKADAVGGAWVYSDDPLGHSRIHKSTYLNSSKQS